MLLALRESFAFKTKCKADSVHLHARLRDHGYICNAIDSITLTGLFLHNATWNSSQQYIETLASTQGGTSCPVIEITASTKEFIPLSNQYLCPLYIHPSVHLCIGQPATMFGESRQEMRDGDFLMHVPTNVQESTDITVFAEQNVSIHVKQR